jgi:hypothetical protein
MGLTYTILSGLCTIFAVVFGIAAYHADKKENEKPTEKTTINVQGDYVHRDKNSNDKINKPEIKRQVLKTAIKKEETIINNGIINSGINNGSQTVNNVYNEKPPRYISNEDVEYLKNTIPLDYKIKFIYVQSTEESLKYSDQIFRALLELGYNFKQVIPVGTYTSVGPYSKEDDRIKITLNDSERQAQIVIREQK